MEPVSLTLLAAAGMAAGAASTKLRNAPSTGLTRGQQQQVTAQVAASAPAATSGAVRTPSVLRPDLMSQRYPAGLDVSSLPPLETMARAVAGAMACAFGPDKDGKQYPWGPVLWPSASPDPFNLGGKGGLRSPDEAYARLMNPISPDIIWSYVRLDPTVSFPTCTPQTYAKGGLGSVLSKFGGIGGLAGLAGAPSTGGLSLLATLAADGD